VAQQTSTLADDLNHTATKLADLKTNIEQQTNEAVVDINSTLQQIDKLNQQIIGVSISGNRANDLMDKRDLLIDQLSSKMNITVEKKGFDGVDIKPVDSTGMVA
jgi:flagellar hook-associated protein 1 FlgK